MNGLDALEAVRRAAIEYCLPSAELKPCVALLLDGEVVGDRHKCAFTIAIELRRMGLDQAALSAYPGLS